MEFLAAPLLWGLGAAGIPLILHLTGRARPLLHRFPAMRFILQSQRSSSRRLKLKHLLVLLLRILALVLIALALARPLWSAAGVALLAGGGIVLLLALAAAALYAREFALAALAVAAGAALYLAAPAGSPEGRAGVRGDFVLVLDQSMSMDYRENEGTRFERARRQALELLDALAPESRVALIFARDAADRVQGRLSLRHETVREKLLAARASGCGLDLRRALDSAAEIVQRDQETHPSMAPPSIVLFTDLQSNAVHALLAQVNANALPSPKIPAPLLIVDVGSEDARNGAVLAAGLPGQILPAESVAALNAKIRPVDKDRPCLVEMFIDNQRVAQKLIEPRGKESVDVDFQFATGAAGPHAGRVHLADADRLPLDQDFHIAYSAGRPARALILESGSSLRGRNSAFFLQAALQPGGNDPALSISGLSYVVEPLQELTKARLAAFKVVILADCGNLSDNSWSALQQWTDEGGGLFVWLGPNTDPAIAARYGFQPHARNRGLLPGNIAAVVTPENPLPVVVAQPEHPVLSHFNPSVTFVLRETQVKKYVRIVPDVRDPQLVQVLSAGDGSPLLLEKSYGRGRVLLFGIDPGLSFSDLPRRAEAFVTLVIDGVRLLAGQDSELKARLGMPLVLALSTPPADLQVAWHAPGSRAPVSLRADPAAGGEPGAPGAAAPGLVSVVVPAFEDIGVHRFEWMPYRGKAPLVRLVQVNADTGESELTRASAENVKKAFAPWRPVVARTLAEANASLALNGGAERGAREFAPGLILVLLALLIAESFLSNRLYRGDGEQGGDAPAPSQQGGA